MNLTRHPNSTISLRLGRRAFQHVDKIRPGTRVVCKRGLLWLTQTGLPQDYVLTAGDGLVVEKRGELLIEAMQEADLNIVSPR